MHPCHFISSLSRLEREGWPRTLAEVAKVLAEVERGIEAFLDAVLQVRGQQGASSLKSSDSKEASSTGLEMECLSFCLKLDEWELTLAICSTHEVTNRPSVPRPGHSHSPQSLATGFPHGMKPRDPLSNPLRPLTQNEAEGWESESLPFDQGRQPQEGKLKRR